MPLDSVATIGLEADQIDPRESLIARSWCTIEFPFTTIIYLYLGRSLIELDLDALRIRSSFSVPGFYSSGTSIATTAFEAAQIDPRQVLDLPFMVHHWISIYYDYISVFREIAHWIRS